MANLLPDAKNLESYAALDPEQLARFASRLATLVAAQPTLDSIRRLSVDAPEFAASLEELQSEAALVTAADLLDRIARARAEIFAGLDASETDRHDSIRSSPGTRSGGELICYWPGRSLSTGEADVASRGFFDVLDRPPIGFWLEAIARPMKSTPARFEIAILSWVPASDVERARVGLAACPNGSLARLGDLSPELTRQLSPLLSGDATTH